MYPIIHQSNKFIDQMDSKNVRVRVCIREPWKRMRKSESTKESAMATARVRDRARPRGCVLEIELRERERETRRHTHTHTYTHIHTHTHTRAQRESARERKNKQESTGETSRASERGNEEEKKLCVQKAGCTDQISTLCHE